jgi:hypothetical protein
MRAHNRAVSELLLFTASGMHALQTRSTAADLFPFVMFGEPGKTAVKCSIERCSAAKQPWTCAVLSFSQNIVEERMVAVPACSFACAFFSHRRDKQVGD